jgi:hypothetical protein
MMRFFLILLGIAIISAIVTILLHQIKVRWIKYIPASLSVLLAIIMIIRAKSGSGEGMQDLGWIVLAMLLFSAAVGGGIMAFVLDWMQRKRNE